MMKKYALLHDDEWDVEVSGGEDQSMMAEVNIFLNLTESYEAQSEG